MKILIVDDNARDRLLMKKILAHHGCETFEAADGQEALDLAVRIMPDVIISDALMPRMDGFQLLREIKKSDSLRSILFVFYTATYTGLRETELAGSLGADKFIIKPTAPDELWSILSGLFSAQPVKLPSAPRAVLLEDDQAYLSQYSSIVASKLEEKVQELEQEIEQRREAEERLQALSKTLLQRLEADRRHIARELHDEIGQVLTAVKLNLQSLQRSPGSMGLVREGMASVDRALQHVRSLSHALRPSVLDDLGLQAALRWLADRASQTTGLTVNCSCDVQGGRLPVEVETACFRIAQEALNNVVRHAAASAVSLELSRRAGTLELVVRDNGLSFDVQAAYRKAVQSESFGLLGMKERAALLGGTFDITSFPGRGTEVRAILPLKG